MGHINIVRRTLTILHWIFLSLLVLIVSAGSVVAKDKKKCLLCSIGGTTSVTAGSTQTYSLSPICQGQATSWSVSCGTVQSSNASAATIYFNNLSCSSAVITAYQNGSPLATLTVTIVQPLGGGSIINFSQNINYNTTPALLNGLAATGGSCGGSYTYQWYTSTDNVNFTSISGATGVSYQPGALTTTTYYKRVVTCSGSTAFTTAQVTVYPQLVSGVASAAQSINYNTAPLGLSTTNPTGGNGTYAYQWYSSPDNTTWTLISGATGIGYNPPALTSSIYYRYVVTSNSANATSNAVNIIVYPQLQAGTLTPSTQTVNYGVLAGITLVGYSGGSGTYTSQWQKSADNSFSNPINISMGPNFSASYAEFFTTSGYYRVIVSSNGVSAYSTIAFVQVYRLFGGVITPASITLAAANTSPGLLSVLPASGGICNGNYVYQWQSGTDSIHFTNIAGATSIYYDPGSVSVKTFYRRRVYCGADSAFTNICRVTIDGTVPDVNYVRERTMMKPGVTDTATANALSNPVDVQQVTRYLDGLGRPIEEVARQASPLQKDLVSLHAYDFFGREASVYLPYASSSNDGAYKINPFGEQSAFNSGMFPNEHFYYGQQVFESSALSRPQSDYTPGTSWIESGRGVGKQYLFNASSDSVQNWTINSALGSLPQRVSSYAPGQLFKTISTDESGAQIVEYKDPMGKVILKKSQLSGAPSTGHAGWLCTYYVYDTLQHLRFIIQPKAVDSIKGNWTMSQSMVNELCFRYEYDAKGRTIVKKSPGAGEVDLVYDGRGRVIMTQDSNMRAQGEWMVDKYDSQNRLDSSGLWTDANIRAYHENLAYNAVGYPSTTSNYEVLASMYYDDYSWVGGSGLGLSSTMATNITSNSNNFITSFGSSPTYAAAMVPNYQTRGLPTGSKRKVMGSGSQYLYSVSFYDDRYRIIQTQDVNYTGAVDTITTQYSFSGRILRTVQGHKKAGNTAQNHTVVTKLDYDASLRLKRVWKNIDNAAADQLIDSLQYDELGKLKAKYLGNGLDSILYDYNIRGWLTGINKSYLAGTASHYFGMELAYDKITSVVGTTSYAHAMYSGNVAGTIWKSMGDGVGRKYDYNYDTAYRLTAAYFLQNTSGVSWDSSYMNFTVSNLKYDLNGNILSMNQSGFKVGGSSLIDQLVYTYQYNKLISVSDGANDVNSKLGDFHFNPTTKGTKDYNYNGNGDIASDNNKAIDTIVYNYLGMPQLVHMKGKGNIQYTYDADGVRIQKLTIDSMARHTTTTLYLNGFVYQQTDTITSPGGGVDTLQFLVHEEGRARWAFHNLLNGNIKYGWEYDFYEKDHLGNPRILLTQEKDTAQYLASMEAAYRNSESRLFYNLTNTGYARNQVSGYPVDTTITNPNDSVARVNGNGNKVGPGIILKVMSGDKVDIAVQSYYNNITDTASPKPSINDVLASLASGIVTMTSGAHGSLTDLNNTTTSPVYAALNSFQGANNPTPSGKPKAYLNWVLLDDQFKYVSSYPQSGAVPVGTANQLNNLGYTGIPISKSGYLYVYVSNETPGWDAFFDNLSVRQYSGPLLEENHYYPFGLTMAAVSDKAIKSNYAENKFKFNSGNELQNNEFSDGSGLELYDAQHRMLDPQLGRFGQIDAIADAYPAFSPYSFAADNPILMHDPNGLLPIRPGGPIPQASDFYWVSDLLRNQEQSVADIHREIMEQFEEDQAQADQAATANGTQAILTRVTAFLSAKIGANGSASANFSRVKGGSSFRVDFNYGTLNGTNVTEVVGVSVFDTYPVGLHQFIAMAVGESGDGLNQTEIKGIGSSMINRINEAGSSLFDPNWKEASVKKYGGNVISNYKVLKVKDPKRDYPQIMGMSMNAIMHSKNAGIRAAMEAYNNWGTDYSNPKGFADTGYYFWNKTTDFKGAPFSPATSVITLVAGGTTFYRDK